MNGTEKAFAEFLEEKKKDGVVDGWLFEPIKFRLAKLTTYTPDFMVIGVKGEVVFYEVKGFWRLHDRVKIKVTAEEYPWFRFAAVQKNSKKKERETGERWVFETIS